MDDILSLTAPAPLALDTLAINMLLSLILASAVAWFYTRYGRSLSNRANFARNLPPLTLTTVLIISIIKSSLALSLGLVGALYRPFPHRHQRTRGTGLPFYRHRHWAGTRRRPTHSHTCSHPNHLNLLFSAHLSFPSTPESNLCFNVITPGDQATFGKINDILLEHVHSADLRRLDSTAENLHATYLIQFPDDKALATLMDTLRSNLAACEFSFVEQDNTLGG